MPSTAQTVTKYLTSLLKERQWEIAKVRAIIREHLPKGYQEEIDYGDQPNRKP